MCEVSAGDLLKRIQLGDEPATFELMDRYAERLIALARKRVSKKLARRIDPEDIVQSACRSFFRNAQAGRYEVRDSDDLWRLLAAITVHKAFRQVKRHSTAKRDLGREDSCGREATIQNLSPQAFSRDPAPDEAATLVEETELMMAGLSPLHRQIVEFTLQGHDVAVTAEKACCSERTVQRALEQARVLLEHRLHGNLDSDPSITNT
jgi:DNA-directed RNA polymerase specialized sigma24 family protein